MLVERHHEQVLIHLLWTSIQNSGLDYFDSKPNPLQKHEYKRKNDAACASAVCAKRLKELSEYFR